ncbi:GGDEF domain-containing protein [Limoniibacter endophyticus]|uniref:diguanylate cyclase n=1 Tax=Limoniibacter endophyticus TaxID=1565040 RepID=A0A8J3GFR2_9HYPH|nr:GGDEF domain-containing protein [Limoniibacter endophyticus]GHC68556.1 hypothetical protein GCM10010136_13380 [Limoniibacter endophyticus]
MTGAWSRRAFLEQAENEVARHKRSGKPLSLALYDLDHFKSINDRHGHPQGDIVLKRTAATVTSAMRSGEILGRIGGEEFAILLPETDEAAAVVAVERYRQAIAAIEMENLTGCRISASFGIAAWDASHETVEAWMGRTDAALYRAKEMGRNRYDVARQDNDNNVGASQR